MNIKTANIGSYPRVGEGRDKQRLRRAISKWEQGEIDDDGLLEAQQSVVKEVIDEQEQSGLDQVTDGMIRWYCPFSHMVRRLEGVGINGLLRYFDTNFYFRQPKVKDEPEWVEPIVSDEYQFASDTADAEVRQVLTGPYTLAKFSIPDEENDPGLSQKELTMHYAEALAEEVANLWSRGAEYIQINEHGMKGNASDIDLLADAVDRIQQESGEATVSLGFSYGSPSAVLNSLNSLPVQELVIDAVYGSSILESLSKNPPEQDLVLGVIDARNTKLEDPAEVADWVGTFLRDMDRETVTLSPSTGLELLPRDRAQDKLEILQKIKEELNNSL